MQTGVEPILIMELIAIMMLFPLMYIASSIKVLREEERAVILRLGKFIAVKGPGIIWIMPILDKIALKVSLQQQRYSFKLEEVQTSDNVSIVIRGDIHFKVVDIEKIVPIAKEYQNVTDLIEHIAQTTFKEIIESISVNELLLNREEIAGRLRELINDETERWGVAVSTVEIQNINMES